MSNPFDFDKKHKRKLLIRHDNPFDLSGEGRDLRWVNLRDALGHLYSFYEPHQCILSKKKQWNDQNSSSSSQPHSSVG